MKALITGGNKGIGYGIAQHLVESKKISELWITSRSIEKAKHSIESLTSENKDIKIHPFELDYLDEGSRKVFY